MLIVIEGGDGAGKTTVVEALAKRLDATPFAFPNDATLTGQAIRSYLRREWAVGVPNELYGLVEERRLSALAFQALQIANRMEVMPELNRAAAGSHDIVCARYWQSGWVYGQLDGLPREWLSDVHRAMARPRLNVLLDLPAEECLARRAARDGSLPPERYEGKIEFTRRVVELYRELWAKSGVLPTWRVVDARQPVASIVDEITRAVEIVR